MTKIAMDYYYLNQYPELIEQMRIRYKNEFCSHCAISSICNKEDLDLCIDRSIEVEEFKP